MTQRRTFIVMLLAALLACALWIDVELTLVPPAPAAAPSTEPTTVAAATQPSAFAPIAYFETNCARCHGAYGSDYGDDLGKRLSDAELATAIDNMAHGPGNAPVDPAQLQILINYHKAMIAKAPFIAVTAVEPAGDGAKLTGEVTPGATLSVNGAAAPVDGHSWSVTTATATDYTATASLAERTVTIRVVPAGR